MTDIRTRLEEADPLRGDAGMSDTDAARMRAAVLGATALPEPAVAWWPRAVATAVVLALMVAVGSLVGRRLPTHDPERVPQDATVAVDGERRQVQFATPGGTRIIWTLDPSFKLGESLP
jgi:hypothetical protein